MNGNISRRDFLKMAAAMGGGVLAAGNLVSVAAALAQGEAITVRFLTPSWASTTDRRVERQIAFRGVLDSFNERFADQGVQAQEVVFDGNPVTLTQEVEAGNVEAIWFNHSEYLTRLEAGHIFDMTPYLNGEDQEFFTWVQEALTGPGGEKAAFWHNTDTPLYYYNTEKIPEPPKTWSEVIAICESIRSSEGGAKYAFAHPFVGWIQMNSGLYMALGGTYTDAEGAPTAFTPENKAIWKKMFEYYIGLVEDDLIPASSVANDQNQQMPDVYAGNVYSFAGNSNFHIRQLQPNLPPEEYEKWAAVPLPYPDEAGMGLYQAGGWLIGPVPSGDSAREAAAAAFTLFATNDRSIANTCKAGGWIPTRPALLAEDPFYAQDPFALVTLQALEQGHVVPLVPIFVPIATAVQTALTRAATGEVSIDQALDDAEAETMREYEALQSA